MKCAAVRGGGGQLHFQKLLAERDADRLGAGRGAELGENEPEVLLHVGFRNAELLGDVLVGVAADCSSKLTRNDYVLDSALNL